jgi:peroxiredoxin
MFKSLSLALVLAGFMAATPAMAEPVVGQPAPAFAGVDSNGKTHNLSDFLGKIVVLEWTNHDCPFVRKHYDSGNMQKLQEQAKAGDVVWLSVVSSAAGKQGYVDGKAANELTASRKASPAAVILDPKGEIGRLYAAKTTPHLFVIDKEGKLAYAGAIDSIPSTFAADIPKATNYVTAAIDSLNAGKPVEVATSKAYGCGVKYE